MEYIKLSKVSQEHASSVFVMMILLITSSSHPANVKVHVRAFMCNVWRCGLTARWRRKWQEWWCPTISPNLSVKSARNLFLGWWQREKISKWKWSQFRSLKNLISSLRASMSAERVEKNVAFIWFVLTTTMWLEWAGVTSAKSASRISQCQGCMRRSGITTMNSTSVTQIQSSGLW